MTRVYYALRGGLTRAADRVGNWCDRRTDGARRFRHPVVRRAAGGAWQAAGSLAHAAKLLPRLDAWRLEGGSRRVVWVGDAQLSHELEHLLFPAGAAATPVGRIAAWRVRRFVNDQLGRADLVVCALPRVWPARWRPRGPVCVTCPVFVNVVVDITTPLEEMLRGRSHRGARSDWNRFRRDGGGWRVARERADVEGFYREMYLPHVVARHGPRALVTSPLDLAEAALREGGRLLLLHSRDAHPVAGVTLRVAGPACILGEEGVLASVESAGYGAGLQSALKCAAIEFAQSLGITTLVMGRSLARVGDPVLQNKLRWAPRVEPAGRSLHPEWTFVASVAAGPAVDQLNARGLITFAGGRPCVVSVGPLSADGAPLAAKIGRALIVGAGVPDRVEELKA